MRNDALLDHSVNKTFDEILVMSPDEFRLWVKELREVIVDLWDNFDLPPRVGFSHEETIKQFREMTNFPVNKFWREDLFTGEKDVIRNTSVLGNAINDWFPTMMKTKITYTDDIKKSKSIYDFFARDDLFETFHTYASRHFKRDSFYHYSRPIKIGEILRLNKGKYLPLDGDYLITYIQNVPNWDYWLAPDKDKDYSGYNQELKGNQYHTCIRDGKKYQVRIFEKGQKLFPIGLKAFRVSFCQYAVNFPPLTAKLLYETYLPNTSNTSLVPWKIYDPSAGWGGRLLGALAVDSSRHVLYIGTDPNTDHNIGNGKTKYHQVAEFFNKHVGGNSLFKEVQEYKIFQLGSEVIQYDKDFQKYKGQIDLVFTSPPYFAKEVYSDDASQSCNKFTSYEDWKKYFLRPTLETAVEWLKNERYLLWNIADAKFGKDMLPLEKDSCDILESLGMKFIRKVKMALAPMPGGNRFVDTGETEEVVMNTVFGKEVVDKPIVEGKMANFCKIEGETGKQLLLKYEPIYCFFKGNNPWV